MRSGISRSNLEKRFKEEVGETIHAMIHAEKLEKARSLLISTTLSINEISQMRVIHRCNISTLFLKSI